MLATDELVQVPSGRYARAADHDTSTIEPIVVEYKLYAPGVGPALAVLSISGGSSREELIKIDTAGQNDGTGPLGHPNP